MRNFIVGIPDALIEAARVEGVSEWKIFWHVVLPLVRPALAALAVLVFTFIWNDFFWALVLVQSDDVSPGNCGVEFTARPVVGILAVYVCWCGSGSHSTSGSVFTMQKHFIAGLTLGATKG